jgi:hypothetical protein
VFERGSLELPSIGGRLWYPPIRIGYLLGVFLTIGGEEIATGVGINVTHVAPARGAGASHTHSIGGGLTWGTFIVGVCEC